MGGQVLLQGLRSKLQPLNGVFIEKIRQGRGLTSVVEVQKQGVEPFHVLFRDGQHTSSGLQHEFICQDKARSLIAIPEELAAGTPAERRQSLFIYGL